MKVLDKEGLTYYTGKIKSNIYTKSETNNLLSAKENTTNKVTTLSNASTDTQYPSAKCVYDIIGDIETILTTLDIGGGI